MTGLLPIEARISYKYYSPRFPELHDKPSEGYQDNISFDASSPHFKELTFFDDMINKIKDEKEIWPGTFQVKPGDGKGLYNMAMAKLA